MIEWKKLGEIEKTGVLTLGRGKVISKADMIKMPGDYPVYSSSSQGDGKIGSYGLFMFEDERITWSIDGGGKPFYRNNEKYSVTNVCGWLKVNDSEVFSTRFLYYILYNQWAKLSFDYSHKAHPSVIRNEYLLPLMLIAEQQRIVAILDTFTASIENLKERITQRRKQYEYYRNLLLDFEGRKDVEMKMLGEIGTFIRGKRFVRTDIVKSGIPCLHYGDFYTTYGLSVRETKTFLTSEKAAKLRFAEKNDVVIVAAGENDIDIGVGVVWLGDKPAAVHDACFIFKHKQNSMYISHFLRSSYYHQQIKKDVSTGKICSISSKGLGRVAIPIPSLNEQKHIVSILDTFEESIANLEAQLKEREKQYEYYRNKLLTFE